MNFHASADIFLHEASISTRTRMFGEVLERLEAGEAEYGDRSFRKAPWNTIAEMQEELSDVVGWGAIANFKISEILDKLPAAAETSAWADYKAELRQASLETIDAARLAGQLWDKLEQVRCTLLNRVSDAIRDQVRAAREKT